MHLKNLVAIVTGASQGIGKETALTLARHGAKVVVNYFSDKEKAQAQAVVASIQKLGSSAIALQADVANRDSLENLFKETQKHFRRIDILVNNAGIILAKPYADITEASWQATIDTNLRGVFWGMQLAGKYLKPNGKVVSLGSVFGVVGSAGAIDYSASKAGVINLTKSFARALATKKILVNAVAPRMVDTPMTAKSDKSFKQQQLSRIALGRLAKPSEIAKLILFLASPDNTYITGQTVIIDGGYE